MIPTDNLLSRCDAVKMCFMKRVRVDEMMFVGSFAHYSMSRREYYCGTMQRHTEYALLDESQVYCYLMLRRSYNALRTMESQRERVIGPTDWYAAMVPVMSRKKDKMCICVDLRRLNESVIREKRTLPVLDDVVHKLAGSTVFSKLEASSGFL